MGHVARLGAIGLPFWNDKPVAIIGGGPSLKGFDFQRLRGRFTVLAVNASVFDAPWADCGFSLDLRAMRNWWPRYRELTMPLVFAVPSGNLENFCAEPTPNMQFVRRVQGSTLSHSRFVISTGGTSGYGALHLAFLKGARDIKLFGFDYGPADGQWHHNESHYSFWQQQIDARWREWAANFDRAAPLLKAAGVKVVNASPASRVTAFEKCTIEEALA